MSSMGKTVDSNLPEDIEERLAKVHETISIIERKIDEGEAKVTSLEVQEAYLTDKIATKEKELDEVDKLCVSRVVDLDEREIKLSQKESALDVYANALKEKEERINKYLNIFENMKNVISK
jgi:chromosome segregation ATPase